MSFHTEKKEMQKQMSKQEEIKLFEGTEVRTVWDEEKEEWFFSVTDVVEVLTESKDPKQYIKKMRSRDEELNLRWGTICTLTAMTSPSDGKKYRTQAATAEGIFRIIQSIPSKKAEPFKQWMAHVAAQRLEQMQDPEKHIEEMVLDYRRMGYSDKWINQRVKSIEVRKEFTDELERAGITDQQQYASLTSMLTKAWSGKTVKEYKQHKGLKKESLRDNMTNVELALNTLAEASATEIAQQRSPEGYNETAQVVKQGGSVAKAARVQLEKQLGRSVISAQKASDYIQPIETTEAKVIGPDEN